MGCPEEDFRRDPPSTPRGCIAQKWMVAKRLWVQKETGRFEPDRRRQWVSSQCSRPAGLLGLEPCDQHYQEDTNQENGDDCIGRPQADHIGPTSQQQG